MATEEPSDSHSRVVARNATLRAGGEIIAKLASIAFFVAVARELGEQGFGDFVFALSFTTVLILGAGLGTEELVAREVARDRSRIHDYLSNVVALKTGVSILILLFAALVVNVADYSADARMAVYLLGTAVAIENLGRTWHSVFQAYERMGFISITLIVQRTATAVAGVGALVLGGGLIAVSLVYLAGAVLGFILNLIMLRRFVVRPRVALDRSRWLSILKAGVPIGLGTVLFTALVKVDQTLLSFLAGSDNRAVGFYGAAARLVEATMFVAWAFTGAALPWLSRQEAGSDRLVAGYELGMKAMAGLLLPVALAFTLFARDLIDLFYGAQYEPAVFSLAVLGAVTVFYGLNAFASTVLVARDRPFAFVRLVAVVVLQNVITNIVLIPAYGADGAAVSAALSGLILTVASILIVRRVVGEVRPGRAFAAPLAGGLAMTATVLLLDLWFPIELLLGVASHAALFLLVERRAFPDDAALLTQLVRDAGRAARRTGRVPAQTGSGVS